MMTKLWPNKKRLTFLTKRRRKCENNNKYIKICSKDAFSLFLARYVRSIFSSLQNMTNNAFPQTPRESLEFIIRSYGGEAIIDDSKENSTRITHQVVDRDFQKHRYLNREYMQPQWVFDSINVRNRNRL